MAYRHIIDQERCKGCGLCVSVCPKNVLEISSKANAKGHFPAVQVRPDDCIYCSICCVICPDVAITIVPENKTDTPESDPSTSKPLKKGE